MKDLMSLAIVPSPRSLIVLLILLINQSATAQDDPKVHKFTLGSYFSQGDYGSTEETDITYFPISYELTTFPWVLSVTAPYLALQGPGDVFFETGNIGGGRDEVNEFVDEQGIGDVFLSATYQFSTLGYRQRGKTPLFDLENSFYASLGMMRQYGDNTFLGLIYDYRERASSNAFESHELMPFVSYNLGKQWNFMLYTIVGFTASSADQTFGLQASYTLP